MTTLAERFWSKVDTSGDCWFWTATTVGGYGRLEINQRPIGAHRVALMVAGVEIPEGAHVHHKCENRLCVRADHLEVVAGHAEHAMRHRRGCSIHGEGAMVVYRSGKKVGKRYCWECNHRKSVENARRKRKGPA